MIAPKVNGLSFVNMMELVGRLPSKTFEKQEVHCNIAYYNKFLMQVAHFSDSPHWIICISSKNVILKALKANSFSHIIVIFIFCIISVAYYKQRQNYLQALLLPPWLWKVVKQSQGSEQTTLPEMPQKPSSHYT